MESRKAERSLCSNTGLTSGDYEGKPIGSI
jgi:hypothetical protein